jgi:hypothetical protein
MLSAVLAVTATLLALLTLADAFLKGTIFPMCRKSSLNVVEDFQVLNEALVASSVSELNREMIIRKLRDTGFAQEDELLGFSSCYSKDKLIEVFCNDFQISRLHALQLNAACGLLVDQSIGAASKLPITASKDEHQHVGAFDIIAASPSSQQDIVDRVPFKEYWVRKDVRKSDYGLKDGEISPKLRAQLEDFLVYMTERNPLSQEPPIRHTTAEVYCRLAKLYCGWWIHVHSSDNKNAEKVGLDDIFPTKEKEGASSLYEFIHWLKKERGVSDSYEANFLRGISKLAKFRFSAESKSDPSYGDKSYEDIPVVREIRKLHRDANRRQKLAPRVSDEEKKWLSWPEYIAVVQTYRESVEVELGSYEALLDERRIKGLSTDTIPGALQAKQRQIAQNFQRYIVLALFATVPDRQRTFRELELGKTFFREQQGWVIKHGPEDYKTGSSYGDRPPMQVPASLSAHIDSFIADWRPFLKPRGNQVFTQPKTGKPFTADTIYSVVARACYSCTGKKTNPHLLRDMIVTHVRGTDASEKELEALAIYMGHSVTMQRSSYDRRSLKQKVSPAVDLLQSLSQL